MMFSAILLSAAVVAAGEPTFALEDPDEPSLSSIPRAAGLGIGVQSEPYLELEDETRIIPAPILLINQGRFSLSGLTASYRVFQSGNWSAAGMLDYRFQGYEEDDSPVFVGMEDRESTLEAGGWLAYQLGELFLTGYAQHDILSRHDGFELRGRAAYNVRPFRGTFLTPYVEISFQSEDLANYYYGVEEAEALLIDELVPGGGSFDRFAFAPGETLTPAVGLQVRQGLSRKWLLVGSIRHEFLPDEVTDSPIVDGDSRTRFGGGLARLF